MRQDMRAIACRGLHVRALRASYAFIAIFRPRDKQQRALMHSRMRRDRVVSGAAFPLSHGAVVTKYLPLAFVSAATLC